MSSKNAAIGLAIAASGVIGVADGKTVCPITHDPAPIEAARFVPRPLKLELCTQISTGESVAAFSVDVMGTVYRW